MIDPRTSYRCGVISPCSHHTHWLFWTHRLHQLACARQGPEQIFAGRAMPDRSRSRKTREAPRGRNQQQLRDRNRREGRRCSCADGWSMVLALFFCSFFFFSSSPAGSNFAALSPLPSSCAVRTLKTKLTPPSPFVTQSYLIQFIPPSSPSSRSILRPRISLESDIYPPKQLQCPESHRSCSHCELLGPQKTFSFVAFDFPILFYPSPAMASELPDPTR